SSTTSRGRCSATARTPSSPVPTFTTRKPSRSRYSSIRSAMLGSSSTTSTVPRYIPVPSSHPGPGPASASCEGSVRRLRASGGPIGRPVCDQPGGRLRRELAAVDDEVVGVQRRRVERRHQLAESFPVYELVVPAAGVVAEPGLDDGDGCDDLHES